MPIMPSPLAGEIWDLELDPQVGREQGGRRPALVTSNDDFNRMPNDLCFIAPITGVDRRLRHHVRLTPPEGGLTKPPVIHVRSGQVAKFAPISSPARIGVDGYAQARAGACRPVHRSLILRCRSSLDRLRSRMRRAVRSARAAR